MTCYKPIFLNSKDSISGKLNFIMRRIRIESRKHDCVKAGDTREHTEGIVTSNSQSQRESRIRACAATKVWVIMYYHIWNEQKLMHYHYLRIVGMIRESQPIYGVFSEIFTKDITFRYHEKENEGINQSSIAYDMRTTVIGLESRSKRSTEYWEEVHPKKKRSKNQSRFRRPI